MRETNEGLDVFERLGSGRNPHLLDVLEQLNGGVDGLVEGVRGEVDSALDGYALVRFE